MGYSAMVHIRLVYMYLLIVPSASSPYLNKIKRMYHLGEWPTLSLEILYVHCWVISSLEIPFDYVEKNRTT